MPPALLTAQFSLAMRWGWFQEGRFLGKVLDEWIADSQEFLHTKLPHLVVIALIAFLLSRLLRLITFHMTRMTEQTGAGTGRLAEVKTLSGIIRATGLAIIGLIAGFMALASSDSTSRRSWHRRESRALPSVWRRKPSSRTCSMASSSWSRVSLTWATRCGWPAWPAQSKL